MKIIPTFENNLIDTVSETLKDKCEIVLSSFSGALDSWLRQYREASAGGVTPGILVKLIVLRNNWDTKERELLITLHLECCSNQETVI